MRMTPMQHTLKRSTLPKERRQKSGPAHRGTEAENLCSGYLTLHRGFASPPWRDRP
jgi:hypothetical protein